MIIIAERINASRVQVKEALKAKDQQFFLSETKALIERGSHFIDLNTSHLPETELSDMLWLIELLQSQFEVALAIDSPDPEVIEKSLKKINRPGQMINSTSLAEERLERIIPLMQEYQAKLIILLMEDLPPQDTRERLRLMEKLSRIVEEKKIPPDQLLIDPLVFSLSTDSKNALYVMETLFEIKKHFSQFKTVVGLSNISYGLPQRRLLNRTFLAMLIPQGLDAALLDPLDNELWATFKAALTLSGQDPSCLGYLTAFRKGELGEKKRP